MSTLAAAALAGCGDSEPPTQPTAPAVEAATARQAPPSRGIDAEFSRLAKEVPGFGGMYYDRTGKLNIYVKQSAAAGAARTTDVVSRLRAVGGAAVQKHMRGAASAVTRAAKYDWAQLSGYKSSLGRIFSVKGVVYTDVAEAENRVRVAITPGASQAAVERELARAGVPRDAVIITRMPAVRKLKTIQDKFRPVPGGVQIVFPAPSIDPEALFVCSVGFNAMIPSRPNVEFFLTASHCSNIQGGKPETPYYNDFPGASYNADRIGIEFRDPSYGDPGGQCYVGFECRFSDALLASYRSSVHPQLGKLARTTFGLSRLGSIVIDTKNPRWNVIGEFPFPFEGEIAHKVGRTTGWTSGPVLITCGDFNPDGGDIVLLCQDGALAGVGGGDSGAPVFERADAGSSDVFLAGILWGGGLFGGAPFFLFSSMEQIEFELGPVFTSAPELAAAR